MTGEKMEIAKPKGSEIQHFDPEKGALKIHALDSAERAAKRAKNPDALQKAVEDKMEAQKDFATHYQAQFGQGARTDLTSATSGASEYCQKHGFSQRTVQRWCQRLLDEAKYHVELHKRMLVVWRLLEMEQAANFSSETNEWYTPPKYLETVREFFGGIDLDPASSAFANKAVQAGEYYSPEKDQDGLRLPWHGRVFCNPPYGKDGAESMAGLFCQKAISEYQAGNVTDCILLVNSSHSQGWQRPLYSFPVCFVDHRIAFVDEQGEVNPNPTFQNIFAYLGRDVGGFAEYFNSHGYVMLPWSNTE